MALSSLIKYILAVILLQQLLFALAQSINKDLVNKKVERNVDVVSQVVKIQTKITLENTGKTPVKSFLYAVEPALLGKLSYISFTKTGIDDEGKNHLDVRKAHIKDQKVDFWEVTLPQSLDAGRTTIVDVETVFSHLLVPHPSQILQSEKQLIKFRGNLYYYTPYATTTQTTTVVMTTSNVESFTKTKPYAQSESTITYGPYENVAPFTQSELIVHFENSNPFLTVTNLERVIEISHWGNIAVEESVHLSHTGAILKGPFSRYEYQREHSASSSVKSFKTVLPAAASDVYYRDEIGNISTSHLRVLEDAVEVDLRPRFPLFGGWKTHYLLGYNLPSYEYLFNSGDDYLLKMRFVDHIYDDMIIDQVTTKIILPEGSKNIHLNVPYDVQRLPDQLHFTYLDTTGRPVVVARKENLVENHIQEFRLQYKYQKLLMLQEPLLVVAAFYLLFLLVIIYVRLDFSISKDEQSENKARIAGILEKVQERQDRILDLYQQLEMEINKLKSSKDLAAFQTSNKRINAEHKTETQALQELQNKLKTETSDSSDKVSELVRLDKQLKENFTQQITYTEKLANNKMKKDQYVEIQQNLVQKKDELLEKIKNITSTF